MEWVNSRRITRARITARSLSAARPGGQVARIRAAGAGLWVLCPGGDHDGHCVGSAGHVSAISPRCYRSSREQPNDHQIADDEGTLVAATTDCQVTQTHGRSQRTHRACTERPAIKQ